MSSQEVLSAEEACAFLRIAKVTLYQYARAGDIPGFKLGRRWKFSRDSLESWLKFRVEEDTLIRQKTR